MAHAQDIHVLVVDDEKIIREGAERILSKEGWRTTIAENGDRGLALMKETVFHILLLDLMMPGVSGMEVLKTALVMHPDILPIIITGYATIDNAVEAMKQGAYDFIPKPFTPDQLRIVVRRAVDKIMLERETQRLRLEQERSLKDIVYEKSRTRTIINHMADGVLVTDRDGMIVLSNPALCRMLGSTDDRLLGKHVSEWIKHEHLTRVLDKVLGKAHADAESAAEELSWGDPPERFFIVHATPVKDANGEVCGSVAIFNDVTKLKEFDRMKSEFVDMVSHEVRAPLSSIRQKLSLLRDGYSGAITREQKEIVERVQHRIDALIGMTSNLLDLSRIESGRLVQQKERLNLGEVIAETITMMTPEADKKGLNCEVTVDAELYPVHADRQGMETVFTNLIANAIKYNRQGGSIRIKVCNRGDCVEIQVRDSGMGIAREHLSRIFDKFFRIRTDYTRSVVGSGIGLPLVKAIVEAHCGTIEVESEPEKGSTFTVLLPRG